VQQYEKYLLSNILQTHPDLLVSARCLEDLQRGDKTAHRHNLRIIICVLVLEDHFSSIGIYTGS
jgi:hypothetical protein